MFSIAVGMPGTFQGTIGWIGLSEATVGCPLITPTICFPAPPSLGQMLQNGLRLVLFDRLRHHVQDVVHHSGTKFQVVVRFDTLLCNGLCDTLAVTAFKLTGEEITEPEICISDT
jgi:hypothetical protein